MKNALALFLAVTLSGLLSASATAAAPPNVVLIISDDQGWTDFGFMGHKVVKTPHLDKLSNESAVFINGYVPMSVCRPSLATMLTGIYPHQSKIYFNDPPDGVDRNIVLPLIGNLPTVPRLLKTAGYRSLQTGKFWEGPYSNAGFTEGMTENKKGGRHGDVGLLIGRQTMKPIYDFIDDCGKSPFFLWYAPMLPHNPHNPPPRILKKYSAEGRPIELAKYWAMCEWFDETCGQLLEYLDKKGLRENTLVMFVVDNGWIQDVSPDKSGRNGAAPKSKLSPYDGGLRTPIMLRWPGHVKSGKHDDLVSTIDFAPTILRACGVKPAESMQGLNLLDVAGGKHNDRKAVFGEVFTHTSASIDEPARSLTHRWVREGDWKLIAPVDRNSHAELYNLVDDPMEEKNLAGAQSDRVYHLTAILNEWWKIE